MSIAWPRFAALVGSGRSFLLTSHVRPDCDALGSELGMASLLEAVGKQVTIVNAEPVPRHLQFIDPDHRIRALSDAHAAQQVTAADVVMVLDHHVGHDDLDAEMFKDSTADSTGRLVVEAAEALGVPLTPTIAMPLLAAMATDTGWFRFSSVSGRTFCTAGQLVDAGARPETLYAALYEQNTLARLHLRGRILATAKSHLGGRLLVTHVTQDDFRVTGAQPGDTEDVVNMLLSVAGSEVAVIFQEQAAGTIKASLRSRADVDVRSVAERFGGGGHRAAAGATLAAPLAKAAADMLRVLRAAMEGDGQAET
jgi:phosphoesterase RecJ-like protein